MSDVSSVGVDGADDVPVWPEVSCKLNVDVTVDTVTENHAETCDSADDVGPSSKK